MRTVIQLRDPDVGEWQTRGQEEMHKSRDVGLLAVDCQSLRICDEERGFQLVMDVLT